MRQFLERKPALALRVKPLRVLPLARGDQGYEKLVLITGAWPNLAWPA